MTERGVLRMWYWIGLIIFLILIAIIVGWMLRGRGGAQQVTRPEDEHRGVGPMGTGTTPGIPAQGTDAIPTDAMPTDAMPTDAMPTEPSAQHVETTSRDRVDEPYDQTVHEQEAPAATEAPAAEAPEPVAGHGERYPDGSTDVTSTAATEFAEPAVEQAGEPGRGTDTSQPEATDAQDLGDHTAPSVGMGHTERGYGEWGSPAPEAPADHAGSEGMGSSSSGGMGAYRQSVTGTQHEADLGPAGSGQLDLPTATPVSPGDERGRDPYGNAPFEQAPEQPSPYGPGSAEPDEEGAGPAGWTVKGNAGSMLFHTEDSPSYGNRADVWFESEDAAKEAGFKHWDRKRR